MKIRLFTVLPILFLASCGGDDGPANSPPLPPGAGPNVAVALPPRPNDIDYPPAFEPANSATKLGHRLQEERDNEGVRSVALFNVAQSISLTLEGDPPDGVYGGVGQTFRFPAVDIRSASTNEVNWDVGDSGSFGFRTPMFYPDFSSHIATTLFEVERTNDRTLEYGLVGPLTATNDIPASGAQFSSALLIIFGGAVDDESSIFIDYAAKTMEGRFRFDNPATERSDFINADFTATQRVGENSWIGELTTPTNELTGQFFGSYFGPYGIETGWVGRVVAADGTVFSAEIRTRRD